ncbi:MAG: hypothetical protein HOB79_17405 [Rhodospirillaceae bacterium]|jgi:hypothetical protein|nr:hypothetical protein [Rhodospirillales bacterium]MBT4702850.1 hypothetical protein [Rhodospirillaceae bacterium]
MARTSYLIFTMALVSVTCISGLTSSAGPFELPVVKAPAGPFKVKPSSGPQLSLMDGEYALNALAIPYIKDKRIRETVAIFHWCGTPTWDYVMKRGMPEEQVLRDRAARIEAGWSGGVGDKPLPR